MHYYNEMFGVWEPLLEPLEIDQTEDFRPWNLGIKVYLKSAKNFQKFSMSTPHKTL